MKNLFMVLISLTLFASSSFAALSQQCDRELKGAALSQAKMDQKGPAKVSGDLGVVEQMSRGEYYTFVSIDQNGSTRVYSVTFTKSGDTCHAIKAEANLLD